MHYSQPIWLHVFGLLLHFCLASSRLQNQKQTVSSIVFKTKL
jgi:hypothetical protein